MKARENYTPEQLELRRKIRNLAKQHAKADKEMCGMDYPGWVVEEMVNFTYQFLTKHGKENA